VDVEEGTCWLTDILRNGVCTRVLAVVDLGIVLDGGGGGGIGGGIGGSSRCDMWREDDAIGLSRIS